MIANYRMLIKIKNLKAYFKYLLWVIFSEQWRLVKKVCHSQVHDSPCSNCFKGENFLFLLLGSKRKMCLKVAKSFTFSPSEPLKRNLVFYKTNIQTKQANNSVLIKNTVRRKRHHLLIKKAWIKHLLDMNNRGHWLILIPKCEWVVKGTPTQGMFPPRLWIKHKPQANTRLHKEILY